MIVSSKAKKGIRSIFESLQFASQKRLQANTEFLGALSERDLKEFILGSVGIDNEWTSIGAELAALPFVETAGGVNPGDRRAIYYMIRGLKCRNVLEIGTHIGASTTYAAKALKKNEGELSESVRLVTVDIEDVNSDNHGAFRRVGQKMSPKALLENIGCSHIVEFITSDAEGYMTRSAEQFDFIFLDGSHAASSVYREIPLALRRLRMGGFILLHDFFPEQKPLWKDNAVLPGPFEAVDRHIREGAKIAILPLGELRWPTKRNTCITSLALMVKRVE